ncbi:MAG: hypothetical protein LBS77_04630 [Desulfovibrio sp.]|nr:hypothetical protein [Desulfovibrio sp.]
MSPEQQKALWEIRAEFYKIQPLLYFNDAQKSDFTIQDLTKEIGECSPTDRFCLPLRILNRLM